MSGQIDGAAITGKGSMISHAAAVELPEPIAGAEAAYTITDAPFDTGLFRRHGESAL